MRLHLSACWQTKPVYANSVGEQCLELIMQRSLRVLGFYVKTHVADATHFASALMRWVLIRFKNPTLKCFGFILRDLRDVQ